MMSTNIREYNEIIETLSGIKGIRSAGQKIDRSCPHPFPARMPFCVADKLIKGATLPGAIVLDPMSGSGTTLFAACHNGLQSYGFDRDPLAVLISRSVTQYYDSYQLEKLENRILARAKSLVKKIRLPVLRSELPKRDQDFLTFWFPSRSQKELFALSSAIKQEENAQERELAWVIFSSLIIAKSDGASYALDISRSMSYEGRSSHLHIY